MYFNGRGRGRLMNGGLRNDMQIYKHLDIFFVDMSYRSEIFKSLVLSLGFVYDVDFLWSCLSLTSLWH